MITIERLEQLQREFDKSISTLPTLSFSAISNSIFETILRDELHYDPPTWPFYLYNGAGVCLYYECLWKYYSEIAYVDKHAKQLRDELLILLMCYRPLTYHMSTIQLRYQELDEFNDHLLSILDEHHVATSQAIRLRELIKFNKPSVSDLSSLAFFHYFLNFNFDVNLVGIDKQTMLLNRKSGGLIVVNATFNDVYNSHSTYIYRKSSERLGQLLLTPESITKFAPIVRVESLKRNDRAWIEIELRDEENQVALQYSDDVFTLSTSLLNRDDAVAFLEGGAIRIPFPAEKLKRYTTNEFFSLLTRNLTSTVEKPMIFSNFGKFVWEIINPIFDAHSLTSFDYDQFTTNVIKSLSEKQFLPELELKAFNTYLGVYPGARDEKFEIQEFLDYSRAFISPE